MTCRHFCICTTTILLAISLLACKGKPEESGQNNQPAETPATTSLKSPFKDSIKPARYELPSGALATWRDYARYRPTLVLYSTHPLLTPIPENRKKIATTLLSQGSAEEIVSRTRLLTFNPAILPPEAVSAAINNRFFSELIIILPTQKKPEELNLDDLRKRMLAAGFLTETEVAALIHNDGVVSGTVRGLPLRIVHPERLPKITTPIILHVDLGYFKDMYVNEVKTPAYDLLHQFATAVRDAGYPALATTLSFSNEEVEFSLESRFIIRDLAALLLNPELLNGNTPASWTYRSKALYATTMFAESEAREFTVQAAQANPDDAAAHYALAIDLFEQKRNEEAFATLDRAVALDSGYALEYLSLAEQGFTTGKTDAALILLDKAAKTLPGHVFIRIHLAKQLIEAGRVKEARPIIAELRKLDWSPEIYPNLPNVLKQMDEVAANDVIAIPQTQPKNLPPKPAGRMPGFNHMGMGMPGK